MIRMNFTDIEQVSDVRVTFEAENNLDFRLGTGPLRHTRLARTGDIAAISRVGETRYELRIYRQGSTIYRRLDSRAIHFIGNQGKRYGFITNREFQEITGIRIGRLRF